MNQSLAHIAPSSLLRQNGRIALAYEALEAWYPSVQIRKRCSDGTWQKAKRGYVYFDSILEANARAKRASLRKELPTLAELEFHHAENAENRLVDLIRQNYRNADEIHLSGAFGRAHGQALAEVAAILRFLTTCTKSDLRAVGFKAKKELYEAVTDWWIDRYQQGEMPTKCGNVRVLQRKIQAFASDGLDSLRPARVGNQNARIVCETTKNALLTVALEAFERLPNAVQLRKKYNKMQREGKEIRFADGTTCKLEDLPQMTNSRVYEVISRNRVTRLALERHFDSALSFDTHHRPHAHRTLPSFAFAKLSMDDKVMRFNLNEKGQCWVYFVFDVYSGAIVGYNFEFDGYRKNAKTGEKEWKIGKNMDLFKGAVSDTFRFLASIGYEGRTPFEVEVEQHLANTLKETGLKEGAIFPYVRFARGGNAKEKHAEGFIKAFKYGVEAQVEGFKARPFARRVENRKNEDRKLAKYSKDELRELIPQLVGQFNNYKDEDDPNAVSRLEKLQNGLLEDAKYEEISLSNLAYHFGKEIETSVTSNQYVRANNAKYLLPELSEWFPKVSGDKVTAYLLEWQADTVYLFQGSDFICEAQELTDERKVRTARVEWETRDGENLHKFRKQRENFDDALTEELELAKSAIIGTQKNNYKTPEERFLEASRHQDDEIQIISKRKIA